VTPDAVIMAAGEGTRLRPLTERWAKPVLPIDGRPVLATLLRELAAAGVRRVWLVTGHLARQVEALAGDGAAFGLEIVTVAQPIAKGSAEALARALAAGAAPPFLLAAADTVFPPGAVGDFARTWEAGGADGAIAARAGGPSHTTRLVVEDGRILRIRDREGRLTAAPLMGLQEAVVRELPAVCRPPFKAPFEVADAFQRAIDAGATVAAIPTGATRDLTNPLDLVEENFPYLRGLVRR
jgi:NDP-sugar pyrophosphorylase family protein